MCLVFYSRMTEHTFFLALAENHIPIVPRTHTLCNGGKFLPPEEMRSDQICVENVRFSGVNLPMGMVVPKPTNWDGL